MIKRCPVKMNRAALPSLWVPLYQLRPVREQKLFLCSRLLSSFGKKPSNEVVLVQLEGLASLNPCSPVLRHAAIIHQISSCHVDTSFLLLTSPLLFMLISFTSSLFIFQSRAWKCGYFLVCPPITWEIYKSTHAEYIAHTTVQFSCDLGMFTINQLLINPPD